MPETPDQIDPIQNLHRMVRDMHARDGTQPPTPEEGAALQARLAAEWDPQPEKLTLKERARAALGRLLGG